MEDFSRWQEQYKSKVLVIIGAGKVEVIAASDLAKEYKKTVSQIIVVAQQQGNTALGWEQYKKLLDEIGNLIGEDGEQGKTAKSTEPTATGLPIHSTQEVRTPS